MMNVEMIEKLKEKARYLRLNNDFIKDINTNKQFLLNVQTEEGLTLLAKNMIMKFNDQFLNKIAEYLDKTLDQEELIINWLKNEYFPFLNMVWDNLNVVTPDRLLDLSVILDNQLFYLKKSSEDNLIDFKLTIYEVPDELKRKLMSLGLLFTEKQVEQNIVINIVLEVWEEVPVSNRDIGEVFPKHFLQDKLYAYAITKAREKNYNRLNWKGVGKWKRKDGMKGYFY